MSNQVLVKVEQPGISETLPTPDIQVQVAVLFSEIQGSENEHSSGCNSDGLLLTVPNL